MQDNSHLMTLRKIIEENPDWLDYPVAIYNNSGEHEYVGASGSVYLFDITKEEDFDENNLDDDEVNGPVVVFSGN